MDNNNNKLKLTANRLWLIHLLSLAIVIVIIQPPEGLKRNNNNNNNNGQNRFKFAEANNDAQRLYEDLMMSYNRFVRPVNNDSDTLVLKMGLKLSQLIDVNLRYQMMTTIVWVEQEWIDYKLKWDPDEYGGITKLHVPAEDLWLPDLVLYNNADGNYEVTILTKAILHNDGRITWKPPAVYKSSCHIDVAYFPFDQQTCILKFGTWAWTGNQIDLRHINQPDTNSSNSSDVIDIGIDLSEFLLSVEWDIMAVPATRKEKSYVCCVGAFTDITFNITMRRKTLFYTVNLIIPCIAMSLLSILVFYLPSDSNEKVSLSISIVLSVDVFLLCLIEIIPPTSFTVPLLGQYLLFTLFLVTLSVIATVYVLNISFRSSSTHKMTRFERLLYLKILPVISLMGKRENEKTEEMKPTKLLTCDICQKGRNSSRSANDTKRRSSSSRHHQAAGSVASQHKAARGSTIHNNMHHFHQSSGANDDFDDEGYHEAMTGIYPDNVTTTSQCLNNNRITNHALGTTNYCRTPSCNSGGSRHRGRQYVVDEDDDMLHLSRQSNNMFNKMISSNDQRRLNDNLQMNNNDIMMRRRNRTTTNQPGQRFELDNIEIETECECDKEFPQVDISLCGLQREVANGFLSLDFVAKRMENRENYNKVEEDWRYIATMIDRFFLIIFSLVCVLGTAFIVLQAPAFYDRSEPIDMKLSKMGPKIRPNMFKT